MEITFRGQRTDNKEWVYWNEFGEYTEPFLDEFGMHSHVSRHDIIPETVGQFTGLKDKNGKKIYDGDIITGGDGYVPTHILWVDEYGGWGAKNLKRNEIHALDKYFKRFIGEIIGCKYENPELLEVN